MTAMLVGRCATCGEVTGEVVPAGEELSKTYCPTCEPIQYNPTNRDIRVGATTIRPHRFQILFDEAQTMPPPTTPLGLGDFIAAEGAPPIRANAREEVMCPNCDGTEFEWSGRSTHLETSRVEYATSFYGTVYADGSRDHNDYETHDRVRDYHEHSEMEDTDYDMNRYVCTNCDYVIDTQ